MLSSGVSSANVERIRAANSSASVGVPYSNKLKAICFSQASRGFDPLVLDLCKRIFPIL